MARGVRFTKAEAAFLKQLLTPVGHPVLFSAKETKLAQTILAKLDRAENPTTDPTVDPAALENALIETAGNSVVRTTPGGYGRVSVQGGRVGATPEQMRTMGRWLARQSWITEPMTILTVLGKWPDWYPKAAAATKPRGTREGLGVQTTGAPDLGPNSSQRGQANTKGRTTPGFR